MKRNFKALRRLRTVFAKVPPHQVHMASILDHESCGTVGCLWGWGREDAVLQKMMGYKMGFSEGTEFLGLTYEEGNALFLTSEVPTEVWDALNRNPHAITKAQVLRSLDRIIAGKPIKPYTVRAATKGEQ